MRWKRFASLIAGTFSLGTAFASCGGDGPPSTNAQPVCADGVCTADETAQSCPQDCAPATQCGDRTCDQAGGECETCSEDCPASACEPCGNGVCRADVETCASCAEDCGECMACGDPTDAGEPLLQDVSICDYFDTSRCLLPFPSDYYLRDDPATATRKRVNLALNATPKNALGVPIRPDEFNRGDGWSPVTTLITKVEHPLFGTALDVERSGIPTILSMPRSLELDSPIVVIDADTGERHPVWAELDAFASDFAGQALLIRPVRAYQHGHRYIVALRNLVDVRGDEIKAGPGFRVFRDCIPTSEAALESRRPKMEEIFGALARVGIKRSELFLAWDFTIASSDSLAGRLLHMRDQAFAELGDSPIQTVGVQAQDMSAEADPLIARVVTGTFLTPSYLDKPIGSSRLAYGPDGKPAKQPFPFPADFTCIIPRSATPSSPSRLSLYGHRTLTSHAEVKSANVKRLAFEHNITFCATDWVGLADDDTANIATVLLDVSNFPSITDRLHQAVLNALFLGRLMKAENGLRKDPNFLAPNSTQPLIDTNELYFFGEEQGGDLGAVASAFAQDWTKAVLSVPVTASSITLTRSVSGKQFMDLASQSYPHGLDLALLLQLVQLPWDSVQSSGYMERLIENPLPNTPAKQILMHEAFGDHNVPNVLTELLARSLGVKVRVPALAPDRSLDEAPFFAIEPIPAFPFDGSALFVWDAGAAPPNPENRPAASGLDPHTAPGATRAFRAVTAQFMGSGGITDVCEGVPCLTDK